MPSNHKYPIPGGDTNVSAKTSSRPRQFSDVVRQKLQSPRTDNVQISQEKQKLKIPLRQPHFDEHRPLRISENPGNERKTREKDELVKHMSNLPAYLQKVEKRENFQDKALNFGVLDWNLLEKWKYSDNGLPRGNADVSSSGGSRARHKGQPQPHSSRPYPTKEKIHYQDIDLSRRIIEKEFETSLRNTFDEPKNTSGIKSDRGMRRNINRIIISEKGTSSSVCRKYEIPNFGKDATRGRRKVIASRVELQQSSECVDKKLSANEHKSLVLIVPKHSPKSNSQDIIQTSEPILSFDGKSREANKETLSAEVSSDDVHIESLLRSHSPCHARTSELLNVGFCSSETQTVSETKTVSPQYKYVDTYTPKSKLVRGNEVDTPRSSDYKTNDSRAVKGNVASPSRRFSLSFGKLSRSLSFKDDSAFPGLSTPPVAVKSGPIRSEPSYRFSSEEFHSCPLPIGSKTKDEPSTRLHSLTSVNKTPTKQSSEDATGPTEFGDVPSRYSSPNRRFGFSLGKMKRSLSFKDVSNLPQLSSNIKEVSDYSVTLNDNKDILHSKSRSSPLRRLLDPILKTKVTHPCPSTNTGQSLKRNPSLFFENDLLNNKTPRESVVQALLQVKTKNGLPLFKLVVNNSSDILVAMKNIIPSAKQDVDSIYTLYSVHEIKKKSGSWINQVHKEKSYGFGYNVVGQMNEFNRFGAESSEINLCRKEFILYSVDRKQGVGEAPELVPHRELASIIVRVPPGKLNKDGDEINIGKELTGKEFLEYLEEEKYLLGSGESERFCNTTVILSGADHGLPKNGVPSSLIQRWRSGGGCDCGGWDVGCKLQILTNEGQRCSLPETSVSSSNRERFNLFKEGEAHDNKPIFMLAPFKKGIYSIEFSASISLLQALSMCIATISSRQSFNLSELDFISDGKLVEESSFSGCSRIQIPSKSKESPGKYVPSPPLSPVGRV